MYRVPKYSPTSVAEHAVALLLCLARKIHVAVPRVKAQNFELDGLLGFQIQGKTVGVLGTGNIGVCFARIMKGFGAHVIAYDAYPDAKMAAEVGLTYCASLEEMLPQCDIISIHVPLLPSTEHLINERTLAQVKPGVIVVNTSRGKIVETQALIKR